SFYTGHISADFLWYSAVAAVVAGGRRFLTPLLYRGILALCGGFLVFLGGYFIYSGIVRF
ncbi:MAG: lysine transporter LysE, partial [Thermoanaerobacterales bacterium]|nr:lysine transporter LysE [Thermoanaerobacterales bacterium]